jgi:DNA adenine methylase
VAVAQDRYPSPLRYPGGKGKLANFIKLVLLKNDLVGSEYVEPYSGGASVALQLLFEEYASHVHINDLNRSLVAFWTVLLERTDDLCKRVDSVRVNTDEFARQRAIQDAIDPDELDLAFSTFFLNRTSRSGIIGGGIIGGHNQGGTWKIDARFNRKDLIRRIERIARFKSRITVTGHDAAHYLQHELRELDGESVIVYLDPPYYVKGSGLYQDFYNHADHEEIAALVSGLDVPWLVSYDAAPEIEGLYSGFEHIRYDLNYSAGVKHFGRECMFFSPKLNVPSVESSANVPARVVGDARLRRADVRLGVAQ